jgi:type II secretory pathway pseudopilin PulG
MMKLAPIRRRTQPSEGGYMLVAVIFMLAILMLTMTLAAPKVRQEIQRDREVETMHRGKQYIRAIQLYYRKFNAYPPNVDALVKTNEIRFLRKKYVDPTTGKAEWKPILMGQNKVPIVYGFFGVAIPGTTMGSMGISNNINGANSLVPGSNGGVGQNSTTGSTTDPNAQNGGQGNAQNGGTTFGGTGSGATGAGSTGLPGSDSSSAFGGQTFGAGIIGFSPNSPKQSILVYKKKTHYNEWEFTYDPMMEQMQMMGGGSTGPGGTPASNMPNSFGGTQQTPGGFQQQPTQQQTPPQQPPQQQQ